MSEIITATYRDGAFIPEQALGLAAGTRVKLIVEPVDELSPDNASAHRPPSAERIAAFDTLCDRLPIHSGLRLTRDQLHERD